jgi:hypothetical protein
LFVTVVLTSLLAPGTPEAVREAMDTSAPALSVAKKKLFVSYLSSVLVKFRQEPMQS